MHQSAISVWLQTNFKLDREKKNTTGENDDVGQGKRSTKKCKNVLKGALLRNKLTREVKISRN